MLFLYQLLSFLFYTQMHILCLRATLPELNKWINERKMEWRNYKTFDCSSSSPKPKSIKFPSAAAGLFQFPGLFRWGLSVVWLSASAIGSLVQSVHCDWSSQLLQSTSAAPVSIRCERLLQYRYHQSVTRFILTKTEWVAPVVVVKHLKAEPIRQGSRIPSHF